MSERTVAEKMGLKPGWTAHVVDPPDGVLAGIDLPGVIEIGYAAGLVESTNLRIDDVWTASRFTHPKPGKQYRNSYGTLPS